MPPHPLIVEAGAFDGQDTLHMLKQWPSAQTKIYSFEPVPEIFARLEKNTQNYPQVTRYQQALGDHCGTETFFISEKENKPGIPSQAGSLLHPHQRLSHSSMQFPRTITVPTIDLDTWAHQTGVDQIDLLWLDTQGMEYQILAAAPHTLRKVRILYTEVGFYENYKNQKTYLPLVAWLTQQGFTIIGKDFIDTDRSFFGNILLISNI
jgi:FkbM family methyltransferase